MSVAATEPRMSPMTDDRAPLILTGLTLVGMFAAAVVRWGIGTAEAPWPAVEAGALLLVFLAGGVPAAIRALKALWQEHELDIDLPDGHCGPRRRRRGGRDGGGGASHPLQLFHHPRTARHGPRPPGHRGADGTSPRPHAAAHGSRHRGGRSRGSASGRCRRAPPRRASRWTGWWSRARAPSTNPPSPANPSPWPRAAVPPSSRRP